MLTERGLSLATMESCTGGLLASAITDVYGSSDYFVGGFVTYTTRMKIDHGVDPSVIEQYGVISVETAKEMARAARVALGADIGIGVTGVAGPEPVEGHPEGTVHFGLDFRGEPYDFTYTFGRSRQRIKHLAVTNALQLLRRVLVETNGAS
jgi:PncC family amidohydrolase